MSIAPADHAWHESQRQQTEAAELRERRRCDLLALARFAILALLIFAIAMVAGAPGATPIIGTAILAGLWLFTGLIQGQWTERRDQLRRKMAYHIHGLARVAHGDWPEAMQKYRRPIAVRPGHAFAYDLDVVGSGGLLERLDTCGSQYGYDQLAEWLLDEKSQEEEHGTEWGGGRAAQVKALAHLNAWRADLYVAASPRIQRKLKKGADQNNWLSQIPAPYASSIRLGAWLGSLTMLGVLAAATWWLGITAALFAAIVLIGIAHTLEKRLLQSTSLDLIDADAELDNTIALRQSLHQVARLKEVAQDTVELHDVIIQAEEADRALTQLEYLMGALARRANPLWALGPGALMLSGVHLAQQIRGWVAEYAQNAQQWRSTLAQVEALSALATWSAEQDGVWPEIIPASEEGALLDVEDLSHPLLPMPLRVGNSLGLRHGQVLVLTGANASGKSTWMRTLSLCILLARAGTTVPATSCRLQPLRLATVMRVHDDLAAGKSRFQAEVARLAESLRYAQGPGPAPVLVFDEILGGTNSAERHAGTEAIIRSRLGSPGVMLVATHDLALAQLAEDFPDQVELAHFADNADENSVDLAFDYLLRPGVIQSTNALRIMRKAGLL